MLIFIAIDSETEIFLILFLIFEHIEHRFSYTVFQNNNLFFMRWMIFQHSNEIDFVKKTGFSDRIFYKKIPSVSSDRIFYKKFPSVFFIIFSIHSNSLCFEL